MIENLHHLIYTYMYNTARVPTFCCMRSIVGDEEFLPSTVVNALGRQAGSYAGLLAAGLALFALLLAEAACQAADAFYESYSYLLLPGPPK